MGLQELLTPQNLFGRSLDSKLPKVKLWSRSKRDFVIALRQNLILNWEDQHGFIRATAIKTEGYPFHVGLGGVISILPDGTIRAVDLEDLAEIDIYKMPNGVEWLEKALNDWRKGFWSVKDYNLEFEFIAYRELLFKKYITIFLLAFLLICIQLVCYFVFNSYPILALEGMFLSGLILFIVLRGVGILIK